MDDQYAEAFDLISKAGDARSSSMLALQASREGDAERAEEHLEGARRSLLAAHGVQTALVQREAQGDSVPVNVILIHAQDHLMNAMVVADLAAELIAVHRMIERSGAKETRA